jgi:hypothetical protein
LAIDSATVDRVLKESDTILARGKAFETLWDLAYCPVPDARTVVRCVRWALANKTKLLQLNSALAVVVPTRPAIVSLCKHVLALFGPKCPFLVTSSRPDAVAFLDAHATPPPSPPAVHYPAALVRA